MPAEMETVTYTKDNTVSLLGSVATPSPVAFQ